MLAYSLCRGCGLKFMNPRPTRQWYLDFYASEFWEDKFQNKSWQEGTRFNWIWKLLKGGVSGRKRKGMKRAQLVVPEILKHVQVNSTSRVLDVGCAFGLILHEIKKATDAKVFGIEPTVLREPKRSVEPALSLLATQPKILFPLAPSMALLISSSSVMF